MTNNMGQRQLYIYHFNSISFLINLQDNNDLIGHWVSDSKVLDVREARVTRVKFGGLVGGRVFDSACSSVHEVHSVHVGAAIDDSLLAGLNCVDGEGSGSNCGVAAVIFMSRSA